MRFPISKLTAALVTTLLVTCSGCSLMTGGIGSLLTRFQPEEKNGRSILRPLRQSQDTVRLEVFFVERPRTDPLMGELLWRDIAPVGSLSSDVRHALQESGFRVGHISSSPPRALETLLGLRTELSDSTATLADKRLIRKSLNLLADAETQIQTSRNYPHMEIASLSSENGAGENADQVKAFENARCLFRITAQKLQDGWATLEFQPEIRHGQYGWRPMFLEDGLSGRTSQIVHPLFTHGFSVSLNQGEMVVISADSKNPDSLASQFFQAPGEASQMQRLLVVRLAALPKVDLAYAE